MLIISLDPRAENRGPILPLAAAESMMISPLPGSCVIAHPLDMFANSSKLKIRPQWHVELSPRGPQLKLVSSLP